MALDSIYASQAGRKDVGREARDLVAASFGGSSKLRRRQQALEAAESSEGGRTLRRRQQALQAAVGFGRSSKL